MCDEWCVCTRIDAGGCESVRRMGVCVYDVELYGLVLIGAGLYDGVLIVTD